MYMYLHSLFISIIMIMIVIVITVMIICKLIKIDRFAQLEHSQTKLTKGFADVGGGGGAR